MSEPSKQVIDFTNKVFDDIDNDKYGFDPLLIIAIANIIINLIKAINDITFLSLLKTFITSLKNVV